MATLGFLHTAEAHVAAFDALVAGAARTVHAVEPALLAEARASGVTSSLRARLADRLGAVAARADVVVCTCSTLGEAAEAVAATVPGPVIRVDRPMAEAAVRLGRRIAVVAAVESTLAPTRALLEACARGRDAEVVLAPCLAAWPLFEAGDTEAYLAAVAAHVRRVAGDADVVALAQASMAPVAALVADLPVPVLSSPGPAVAHALRVAGAGASRASAPPGAAA